MLLYVREPEPIPKCWTIDQACGEKDCLDHLECVTRAEHLRRRHARARRAAGRPHWPGAAAASSVRRASLAILNAYADQGVPSHWYAVPPIAQERILHAAAVLDVRDLVTVWDWPPATARRD